MKPIIDKEQMFIAYKLLGQDALAMNHYELEACSESSYSAEEWKQFLSEPDIQEYIKREMDIIRSSQMNKIVQESSDSRSVAKAQLLSALQRMEPETDKAGGPIFIYCYVPLNEEQKHAPNVMEVDEFGKPKA